MTYIDKNLLTDERIIFRTKKHRIIFFLPIVWTIFSLYSSAYMQANPILIKVQWAPWLLALLFWGYVGLEYLTSEFAVTNKRIMMREGFFYRHMNETRLTTVSQVNIDQSLLGRVLNYGTVSINAFGAYDSFSTVAHPVTFQKYVNEQLDKLISNVATQK
ncbi:MAG TPA: PH domain-containing protein [Gammaproteobacteria bacterium]|nr:PH domain-containing protein [Gammaproteobacteria bacterium]